ncbi:MAG: glycosyltransferase, partial [Pseudonocardia sp.]|nr:glycosyltransferase [Pseudonocardia sp.]
VVATAVGDVPSVLRPGTDELGALVPPGRPGHLARALVAATAEDPQVAERAARARAQVLEHASADVWCDRLLALLGRHVEHRRADDDLQVALVSHGYAPRIGGIERQRAVVTPLLRSDRVDARVICRRDPGTARFDLVAGVPVHRIAVPGPKPVASVTFTLGALGRVLAFRPEVIHAHEFHSTARVGLLASRILRRPLVVSAHRSGPLGDVQRQGRRLSGRRRTRSLIRRADLLIAVSEEVRDELVDAGAPAERVALVRNGVDTERFRPASFGERAALRAGLGVGPDEVVTVFVGRVAAEKRIDLLISAWLDVHAALGVPGTLLVAGDGPERARLEAETRGRRVRWLGVVDDPSGVLRAADVFVLPSEAEGLSNALLEAGATGLGLLVTDVGGAREVVDDGESGVVVPAGDLGALSDALKRLVGDGELRQRLGRGARQRTIEQFSAAVVATRLADHYRRLAGRPTPHAEARS